jgi:hypothetical protein
MEKSNKTTLWLYGVTLIIALVILMDFTMPGTVFTEDVTHIKKTRQNYYNAAGNYHYSYRVITPKHQFSVSEDFGKLAQDKKVKYSVSLLFKEINSYRLVSSEKGNIYSFRLASGLIFPLLVIFAIILAYRYKKKMGTLLFVLQVVLLANLVLLIR